MKVRTQVNYRRQGASLLLLVLTMTMVIGMVAFAIDTGRMGLLRCELQNSVDAAALAASLRMRQDFDDIDQVADAARSFLKEHRVGTAVTVPDGLIEVKVGTWDTDTRTFTESEDDPNAIEVSAQQPEGFLFDGLFGNGSFTPVRSAIAAGSNRPIDLILILDLSGSMVYNGRIEALQNAAPSFITLLTDISDGDDQLGIMGLAANPSYYDPADEGHDGEMYNSGLHADDDYEDEYHVGVLEARLTTEYADWASTELSTSNVVANKYYPYGYTGTGAALGDATHYLVNGAEAQDDAQKIVVLLSDGYANMPGYNETVGTAYALSNATYASDNNVTVYTISLGTGADTATMQSIADNTGGTHFDATGSGEDELTEMLEDAFTGIIASIKRSRLVQ